MLIFFAVLVVLSYGKSLLEGKMILKEICPDPLRRNTSFGSGYNSISLKHTSNIPVVISRTITTSPTRTTESGSIKNSFYIRHYNNRDDFKMEFQDEFEIAQSEEYMGISNTSYIKLLTSEDLSVLDSFATIDLDISTDTESVSGTVALSTESKALLDAKNYKEFIKKFGTHYLRKKVYGGKLLFLIKFSSKTLKEKQLIDEALKKAVGYIGDSQDFRNKMAYLEKLAKLELKMYTFGGETFTGKMNLQNAIKFVQGFPQQVRAKYEVKELEFLAIWSITGVAREFRKAVFSYQKKTDKIISISTELVSVKQKVADIEQLRYSEMAWISQKGWGTLEKIERDAIQYRNQLTTSLQAEDIDNLDEVISNYQTKKYQLENDLKSILSKERNYNPKDEFYLKAVKPATYVSLKGYKSYATASKDKPVKIYFEDSSYNPQTSKSISYSVRRSMLIKSKIYPNMILCMGPNIWGIFWKNKSSAYLPYCTWTIKHSVDPRKMHLDYSDTFCIYNVYWPNYGFGLTEDKAWLYSIYHESANDMVVWKMKKIQQQQFNDKIHYKSNDQFYLRSVKPTTYVSYKNSWGYATVSDKHPAVLYFEDSVSTSESNKVISYSAGMSMFIKSALYPNKVLCMAPDMWEIIWKHINFAELPQCRWTIKHSTDPMKTYLAYSDKFSIYNVNWPTFGIGLTDNTALIYSVQDKEVVEWKLEKMQKM